MLYSRKLLTRIPGDDFNVVDKKSQVTHVKGVTFQEVPISLYLFDKVPLFVEFDEKEILVPTVYFLWKSPSVYPMLVVHEPVLHYLENGADLMLQGTIYRIIANRTSFLQDSLKIFLFLFFTKVM